MTTPTPAPGERLAETRKSTLTAQDRVGLAWVAPPEKVGGETTRIHLSDGNIVVRTEERREIFCFTTEGETVLFDVRGIKDAVLAGWLQYSVHQIDLNEKLVADRLARGGVEEPHVARIKGEQLNRPGVMIWFPEFPDVHHVLIDGNHRVVARWRAGLKTFKFVMVSYQPKLMPYIALPGEEAKFFPDRDEHVTLSRTIIKV